MFKRAVKFLIWACLFSLAAGGILTLLSTPEVQARFPGNFQESAHGWDIYFYGFGIIAFLLIPFLFVLTVIAIVFFPVIFSNRRGYKYWLRTLSLTGGFVCFFLYHSFDCQFIPPLGAIHNGVVSSNNGNVPNFFITLGVSLAEASLVFLVVTLVSEVYGIAIEFFRLMTQGVDAIVGRIEHVWSVLKPVRREQTTSSHERIEHGLYLCILLNIILFGLACYPLLSISVAANCQNSFTCVPFVM
jgi:hypothetical protein